MLIIFVSIHLEHCPHFIFKYNLNLSLSFSNCLLYYDLTINEPIGRSDHRAIGLDVLDSVIRIKRNTSLEFTFSKVKKQA